MPSGKTGADRSEDQRFHDMSLEIGCSRKTAVKSIPLILEERNDQATFDRLYEILEDLMRNHRVA
jgi:hypothetical protein